MLKSYEKVFSFSVVRWELFFQNKFDSTILIILGTTVLFCISKYLQKMIDKYTIYVSSLVRLGTHPFLVTKITMFPEGKESNFKY